MGMLTAPRNAMIAMLVQCHRLLNWQGNAFNEASLRERIYSDALPLLDGGYDRAELEQMRPFILVGHDADQALHVSREGATAPWWKGNGALELMFEVNCKNSDPSMNLNLEFRRILPEEAKELAGVIDEHVGQKVYERMLAIAGWME